MERQDPGHVGMIGSGGGEQACRQAIPAVRTGGSVLPQSEGDVLRRVLVCPPLREYTCVDDKVRQNFVEVPCMDVACVQHGALRRALANAGAEVVQVPELD